MALFSRTKQTEEQRSSPEVSPIREFWRWWSETGRHLDPTGPSDDTQTLHELLLAIHPGLTWHVGPGDSAQHRLTVSAGGSPEGRPSVERWHRVAPAPDATWEFGRAIQADPAALQHNLRVGDVELALTQAQFAIEVDPGQRRVHVQVYHPDYGALPEEVRVNVSLMILEWVVGEDDLERWIGAVEPVTAQPAVPASDEAVRAAVAELVAARDFEDEFIGIVEPGGLFMASETINDVRILHAYTDSEDENVTDKIVQFATSYDVHHDTARDLGWSEVRPFTG